MSAHPSWRLRQPKKKQSDARLSLVFAEPQSSPPRATAMGTLDTVQAKDTALNPEDKSPQPSLHRSPSVASTIGKSSSASASTRGSISRATKRQRLSDDLTIPPVPTPAPEQPATSSDVAPGLAATAVPADASQQHGAAGAKQSKSGWFGFKKPSNASLASNAHADSTSAPPPPAPEPARESAPEAVMSSAPADAPSAIQHIPTSTHEDTLQLARSPESTSTLSGATARKRTGWFGLGGNSVADSSASGPDQLAPPRTGSPEPMARADDAHALAPVTPPPTPPRRDPSPPRTEAIPISVPKSNNDDASSKRGWFGSLGRHTANPSITSLPESIDSHVPTRVASPEMLSASPPPRPVVVPVQQTVSTMNSSGPRYTLSIPLLGRPKVPLEAIAKVEKDRKAKEGPEVMEIDFSSADDSSISSAPAALPSSEPAVGGQELTPRAARQEASWLSYIWSATPAQSTQSLPVSPAAPAAELPPSPAASNPDLPAPRGLSADAASRASTAQTAWYAPWTWSSAPSEDTTPAAEPAGPPPLEEPVQSRPQSPEPEPHVEENPLLRTAEQRASWVTFFTGRGRAPTTKKMYDENGGMEIMDLDDDPPAQTQADSQTATPAQDSPAITVSKPPAGKGKSAAKRNTATTSTTEPPPGKPPAQPITDSQSVKHKVSAATIVPRPASPAPSKKGSKVPPTPRAPNLVLPTFEDTFKSGPRLAPPPAPSTLRRTLGMVRDSLFAHEEPARNALGFESHHHRKGDRKWARQLPRSWSVLNGGKGAEDIQGLLQGCKRVVILGVHGWFPGAIMRTVLGEPTGTSAKFATMMETAVQQYMDQHGHVLDKVTTIPLEGEGTIDRRVEKLYQNLMGREDWVEDLHLADVVFVATHSQGSVASTHLLLRLIHEGHIRIAPEESGRLPTLPMMPSWAGSQRVCCLALCGIHLGPLSYLHQNSIVQPYLQYFESAAATELFEFQASLADTNSAVSKRYFEVLKEVISNGVRFVYIASLDDQVVPIYSGTFTSISHPLILRSLYIDGDAYSSSDFLSNLLILLLRLRNAGIDDAGLIALLSEATAGSLSGVGHSSAYEELGTYSLAVRFLFEASGVLHGPAELEIERFSPRAPRNDYEIPWALRHILADPRVGELFGQQFIELRAAFDDWQPKTAALKDIRRKLEPIRRLPTSRL
ncbi:hypothetical protein EXIGLDRAFT_681781 [Exidia glandulosa HHB12029]|uniref:YMC020W-like alpha/beta hydrolase domain-containing protein n=1 Tax=Exidia glandulosa HHB12029 TaxID=1314781 RepID=A0A165DWM2_EXIGL|nr:hypothetical protein EXIGLDRAFT_681781 [Exidia glandulosa HHB12029]